MMNAMKDALAKKLMEMKMKGASMAGDEKDMDAHQDDGVGNAPDLDSEDTDEEAKEMQLADDAGKDMDALKELHAGKVGVEMHGKMGPEMDHHMKVLSALSEHHGGGTSLGSKVGDKAKAEMASMAMKKKKGY